MTDGLGGAGTPGLPDGPFELGVLGRGLVFAQSLPALAAALTDGNGGAAPALVVQAPPGTGKTTLVPPLLANALAATPTQRILVTQPRRVAVRSAARRLAALAGSALGATVGYSVRGESHTGPQTIVEFLTPGILLRRLLRDPELAGVAAVVLDEVHERGLDTDLLLGILGEVRELRGDLTLVAMSATLDAARFARLLGTDDGASPAPVVDCPAALFPLTVRWEPASVPRMDDRGIGRAFLNHVADTAARAQRTAVAADPDIDVLVFAPGAAEVAHIAARLGSSLPGAEVLQLHGQVPAREQDRAVSGREPGGVPRVIVSTSLAESSLTVPGVRVVVDSGLSREPRRDAGRGMTGLVTVSTSRASAEQRAGRAARQGPGTVVRCYEPRTFAAAPAHPTPEIAAADLTQAALTLACWGTPAGAGLRLPDPPPALAMAAAVEALATLGAVDAKGHATALGHSLADIPADPRLARALLAGAPAAGARRAAEIVAAVSGDERAPGADLTALLASLRAASGPHAGRWSREVRRLESLAGRGRQGASAPAVAPEEVVGFVVGLAFPDRVARLVPGTGGRQYLLASGTRAGLPANSSLSGHEWLAVAEAARAQGRDAAGTGALIRAAAALAQSTAEAVAAQLVQESVAATFNHGKVTARRERRLGAIVLASTPVRPTTAQGREAVAAALEAGGAGMLTWSAGADALRRRLALLHRELGAPWPDVSDAALMGRLSEWLAPELEAVAAGRDLAGVPLAEPLRRLLPWPEAARLGELAPETLAVPSGSNIRLEYPDVHDGGAPVAAVKLQECFGLADSPLLVQGRVRVVFHLLSPARRPLAITSDLASFWSGPYGQVRAEMRGRYPKHPWPEDPWTAPATAKVKKRL